MRIKTKPAVTRIDGTVTAHTVSVVGILPREIFYVEEDVAVVEHPSAAPLAVGAFLRRRAERMNQPVPEIPGVTAPGEWVNPRFGDPEAWRAKHSLEARDRAKKKVTA